MCRHYRHDNTDRICLSWPLSSQRCCYAMAVVCPCHMYMYEYTHLRCKGLLCSIRMNAAAPGIHPWQVLFGADHPINSFMGNGTQPNKRCTCCRLRSQSMLKICYICQMYFKGIPASCNTWFCCYRLFGVSVGVADVLLSVSVDVELFSES